MIVAGALGLFGERRRRYLVDHGYLDLLSRPQLSEGLQASSA